ncbi:MAG: pseudouridine synthase, partial [Terracidiphilus sp.]
MPRKKTTASEAEPAAKTRAQVTAAVEPGDDVPKPRRKTPVKAAVKKPAAKKSAAKKPAAKKAAAKKAAVKKRAGGSKPKPAATANVPGEPAEGGASQTPGAVQAETTAQAADTFEDAFEANDTGEAGAETDSADPLAHAAAETGAERRQESSQNSSPESSQDQPPANQQRLQKILAAAGVASRRHAEQLIVEGRVEVNGQVVTTLGSKADPERDHIRVDGKLIHGAERQRYFMLNKPRGYVTTVSDPEGRPTVMQFFERMRERLYPVGRLDYLSEGLLLMTNDGELANKLTRAASGVEKIYLVKVAGQPGEEKIDALREGVRIDKDKPGESRVRTSPARIRQIRQGENPWFEVGLIEGRNRELRKMFEEIGHHVEKIRRVGYGPLELDLEPGKMRELTPEEVQKLRLAAEGKFKPKRWRASDMLPREAGRTVNLEAGNRGGRKPFRSAERPAHSARPAAPERRSEHRPEFRSERGPDRRPERGFGARPERGSERGGARSEYRPRREQGGFAPRQERREFPGRADWPQGRRPGAEGAGQRES